MSRLIALCVVIATATAYADPASVKVKTALIETPSGDVREVDGGVWINNDGVVVINTTIDSMKKDLDAAITSLKSANQKLAECQPYIPGFPAWATVLISSVLSIASTVAAFFVVQAVK